MKRRRSAMKRRRSAMKRDRAWLICGRLAMIRTPSTPTLDLDLDPDPRPRPSTPTPTLDPDLDPDGPGTPSPSLRYFAFSTMASITVPQTPAGRSCPIPGTTISLAPGIARAVASPPDT